MKKNARAFLFAALLFFSKSVAAVDLSSQVESFKLANGMRWLLVTRPNLPVFSGIVMVRVGGVDEVKGKTGLAHMFEHMAFKGSSKIGTRNYSKEIPILKAIAAVGEKLATEFQNEKPDLQKIDALKKEILALTQQQYQYMVPNEVWATLSQKGAVDLNAFTSKDVTAYHASMPIEAFSTWAHLLSEMVFHPVLREFYQERDVVLEERRLRYDNSPQGYLVEHLLQTAFPEGPYHSSPIGHAIDLVQLTMGDAESFHKKFYTPKNMVGVLVGAISKERAQEILNRYFGSVDGRTIPKEPKSHDFSFQGEKRLEIAFEAEPFLAMAFYKPKAPARDDYRFDMLNMLLCEGRTSRFNKVLVQQKKMASNIYCSATFPGSRQENLFVVFASPLKGVSLQKLEKALNVELARMSQDLTEKELERVRQNIQHQFLWNLEENMNLAEQLALSESVLSGWRYVADYAQVMGTMTLEEIQKTAAKFFVPENRVVVHRLRGKQK